MKTYRYSFDETGCYLLDNKGNRTGFEFHIKEDGKPVFTLTIPENNNQPLEGTEPFVIIRYVNRNMSGVIIQPFDVD